MTAIRSNDITIHEIKFLAHKSLINPLFEEGMLINKLRITSYYPYKLRLFHELQVTSYFFTRATSYILTASFCFLNDLLFITVY